MSFDRAAALATIEKLENKKLRLPTPAMAKSGVVSLKELLTRAKPNDFESLTQATAADGNGATDYALATLVPMPTGPEQRRKAGILAGRQVIVGDLVVEGPLTVTGATFVTGSVKASAVSVSESGVLVVNGNLDARVVMGDGWLWVRGDVNVELAIGYHRKGELRVGGTLRATLGIMSDHGAEIANNATKHWFAIGKVSDESDEYRALFSLVTDKAVLPAETKAELGIHRIDFRALSRLAALKQPLLHVGKAKVLEFVKPKYVEPPPRAKGDGKGKAKLKVTKPAAKGKVTKATSAVKASKGKAPSKAVERSKGAKATKPKAKPAAKKSSKKTPKRR